MKNRDLFSQVKKEDKSPIFLGLQNDSSSYKQNISNSLHSKLEIKNLRRSAEPETASSLIERLNSLEEVTSKSKGKSEFHKVRGISKSYTNQKFLEENVIQMNRSREYSMNSTAIGSVNGDHLNLTNSKLIKDIHSYRYYLTIFYILVTI